MNMRNKELETKLKEREREIKKLQSMIEEEKEKVDILKKSLHIFTQQPE